MVVVVLSAVTGCSSGEDDKPEASPTRETLEMPTYRLTLPEGWHVGMDSDPPDEDGAGFRGEGEIPVHGSISRHRAAEAAAAGLGESARERIVKIVDGHRGVSNIVEIGEVEPLGFDIDGAEAWRSEARFGSAEPEGDSFRSFWVAFQHDGQDYVVTFEGNEPVADRDRAAFEELLRSWEFT
jgi:hypothetical protein